MKCPVCWETFRNEPAERSAYMAPCGHSFCQGCSGTIWAGTAHCCPTCRAPWIGGIEVMRKNFALNKEPRAKGSSSSAAALSPGTVLPPPDHAMLDAAPQRLGFLCSSHSGQQTLVFCRTCTTYVCATCIATKCATHYRDHSNTPDVEAQKLIDSYGEAIVSLLGHKDTLTQQTIARLRIDDSCTSMALERLGESVATCKRVLDEFHAVASEQIRARYMASIAGIRTHRASVERGIDMSVETLVGLADSIQAGTTTHRTLTNTICKRKLDEARESPAKYLTDKYCPPEPLMVWRPEIASNFWINDPAFAKVNEALALLYDAPGHFSRTTVSKPHPAADLPIMSLPPAAKCPARCEATIAARNGLLADLGLPIENNDKV